MRERRIQPSQIFKSVVSLWLLDITQRSMGDGHSISGKEIDIWITKPMALATRFQICNRILVATYICYSSYWVSSTITSQWLEKSLCSFLWAGGKGFHYVKENLYFTPRDWGYRDHPNSCPSSILLLQMDYQGIRR